MKTSKSIVLTVMLVGISLLAGGCFPAPTLTPTHDINLIVAQTLAAHTVEAALTQAAGASQTPPPPSVIPSTPSPVIPSPPPASPTSIPEEIAPDPLPMTHTGIILNNGECFNFDNGQITAPDAQCDVWLVEPALFRQMNGARISGYVTLSPPTRSHCTAGRYELGDLAVQTDMYMCFFSNEGRIGFIVARQYRGGVPFTGIVFDYWVFR